MKNYIRKLVLSFILGLVALSGVASASTSSDVRTATSPIEVVNLDSSLPRKIRLPRKISRTLKTNLYDYSLFDLLSFQVDGSKVTLFGQVSWPALKPTAERLVANIEGVTSVENQIEVLPTSFYDDRLRLATMRALFSNAFLSKYAWFGSSSYSHGYSLRFGSYSHIPYRSDIHIIVKNGNVTLEGVVSRKTDSDVASLLANSVSGVFSVTNNLRVENPVKKS